MAFTVRRDARRVCAGGATVVAPEAAVVCLTRYRSASLIGPGSGECARQLVPSFKSCGGHPIRGPGVRKLAMNIPYDAGEKQRGRQSFLAILRGDMAFDLTKFLLEVGYSRLNGFLLGHGRGDECA